MGRLRRQGREGHRAESSRRESWKRICIANLHPGVKAAPQMLMSSCGRRARRRCSARCGNLSTRPIMICTIKKDIGQKIGCNVLDGFVICAAPFMNSAFMACVLRSHLAHARIGMSPSPGLARSRSRPDPSLRATVLHGDLGQLGDVQMARRAQPSKAMDCEKEPGKERV